MNQPVSTLSVLFPAYNDERNINRLVPETVHVLQTLR